MLDWIIVDESPFEGLSICSVCFLKTLAGGEGGGNDGSIWEAEMGSARPGLIGPFIRYLLLCS